MSEIKLKRLVLKNFKGIKNLAVDFEDVTNIYGENKLGKTTVFDGFTWLLFDKDCKDRSKFEVQPLDETNKVIHMLETKVVGILEVDGKTMELKKILKERWIKKRGEVDSEFKGTETLYYINEVPLKLSEYKDRISKIIEEPLFKLISNPLYFSLNIKWQDRRKVILDVIGDISKEKVINHNPDLKPLINLLKDSDIDSLNKLILARKKRLNEDKKSIPIRIDELNNSINRELDFPILDFMKRSILSGLARLDEEQVDSSKVSQDLFKDKDRLYEIKAKLRDIEFAAEEEAKEPLKKLNNQLAQVENSILKNQNATYRIKEVVKNNEGKILSLEEEMKSLRAEFQTIQQKELEICEEEFVCPTCRRAFEDTEIEVKREEMKENFLKNKVKKLQEINNIGLGKSQLKEKLETENTAYEGELDTFIEELDKLMLIKEAKEIAISRFNSKVDLSENVEYEKLKLQEKDLEEMLQLVQKSSEIELISEKQAELAIKKEKLLGELEEINNNLGIKEQNDKIQARIQELKLEEKKIAQQIADLETQEFLCEKYTKTKVELLEAGINSKFKYVKFKLFNTLVNGAVEDCCEALIDGVPFSNANTASQINAGIDIINALSEYYKICAPIFIDNRESVNEILDCKSQIINLIVSKDKELVIEKLGMGGSKNAYLPSNFEITPSKIAF